MNPHLRHLAVLLCPVLLFTACGPSREQRTTRLLDQRLQAQLAPDIAANRAVLQPLPNGARVTLLDNSMFPTATDALDNREADPRADVIASLLDPLLMQVQLADTSTLPQDQRDTRVRNVITYFGSNGLAGVLRPADPVPPPGSAGGAPAGLAITISVICPHRHDGTGYGSGKSKPACY